MIWNWREYLTALIIAKEFDSLRSSESFKASVYIALMITETLRQIRSSFDNDHIAESIKSLTDYLLDSQADAEAVNMLINCLDNFDIGLHGMEMKQIKALFKNLEVIRKYQEYSLAPEK